MDWIQRFFNFWTQDGSSRSERPRRKSDRKAAFHRRRALEASTLREISTASYSISPASYGTEREHIHDINTIPVSDNDTIAERHASTSVHSRSTLKQVKAEVSASNSIGVDEDYTSPTNHSEPDNLNPGFKVEYSDAKTNRSRESIALLEGAVPKIRDKAGQYTKGATFDVERGRRDKGNHRSKRTNKHMACLDNFKKMESNINDLIAKGKLALEKTDVRAAREYALKAVVGANDAKDKFLQGLDGSIKEANLEHWFGECAFILHGVGDDIAATQWFYTATAFPVKWTKEEHLAVSQVLWNEVLYSKPLHVVMQDYKKICSLLTQLEGISKLAVKRQKWNVGMIITHEIQKIHVFLNQHACPFLHLFPGTRVIDRTHSVRSVTKLMTKCALELGNYLLVKKLCMLLLQEFSDYNDAEALEIWGIALYRTGDFENARKKCELAMKYAKDEDDCERLTQVLINIESDVPKTSPEADKDWLPEGAQGQTTNREIPSKRESEDNKGKKKKQKRRSYAKVVSGHQQSTTISPSPSPRSARSQSIEKNSNGSRVEIPDYLKKQDTDVLYQTVPTYKNGNNSAVRKVLLEHGEQPSSRTSSMCSDETSYTDMSYKSYEISLSDLDSDTDETTGDNDSIPTRSEWSLSDVEPDEITEEPSFYEQSCRYFSGYQPDAIQTEITDENLLRYGLKLSTHYLHQFADKSSMVDQRQAFYDEFLKPVELRECLLKRPDVFKRCVIQIDGSHLSNCTPVDSKDKINMIEISGRSKAGQVFNEDEVVVEVLDKAHDNKDKRYGRVAGVLNRRRHKDIEHPVFICTLDDMESHLVRPMCKTVPKIHILNNDIMRHQSKFKRYKVEIYDYDQQTGTLCNPTIIDVSPGDRQRYVFLVAYIAWSRLHVYPIGAVIKRLPCGSTINRGLMILNLQHEVPSLYKEKTIRAVESMTRRQGDEPSEAAYEGRKDLTGLNIFTIDPPGSRDLDDALSIEKNAKGYKVGVHIADVAALVEKDDPVDEEAKQRAVTFYPGIRRPRNMLPEPLSSNHCSLLPKKRRLTLSVLFYLDSKGQLLQMEGTNPDIQRSFIRSRRQFTYREVQDIIDNKQTDDPCAADIKQLFKLANARRKERLGNSMFALDLENDEDLQDDSLNETLEAHYLVEEYMILANKTIAHTLFRRYRQIVPLRCQPPPTKDSMEAFVKKHGCLIDTLVRLQDKQLCDFKTPNFDTLLQESSDRKVLISHSLWNLISTPSFSDVSKIIKTDDLHPLQHLVYQHWLSIQERASYKCFGSQEDCLHYSLKCNQYTHFTSPIRRYNDLIVQRLVHAHLDGKPSPYERREVESICIAVNSMMKRSKDYEKGCKALQKAVQFKSSPEMIKCFVDDVSDRSVSLSSPEFRHVSKQFRELSFNLLDMSFKPEVVTNTTTGQEIVTATWRKRLYDSKGVSSNPPDRGNIQILNPHQGVVFIFLHQWARMLKCAVDGRLQDLKRTIRNADVTQNEKGFQDISTECYDPMKIQPNTKFSLSFTHGQTVHVQMSAEPQKGMLAPRPVLYNMTNNAKFCLQHTDDPVLHLSRYTTMPTCDQYKTIRQYQQRWIPLIHMEAATGAVRNEESFVINSLPIKFTGERQGKFGLPLAYCEIRNIEFSGTLSEDDDENNEGYGMAYDWLCIKFEIPRQKPRTENSVGGALALDTIWVAHAEVLGVKKRKGDDQDSQGRITVTFNLHDRSPSVPMEVKLKKQSRFTVEVLTKSEVDRRTECFIQGLSSVKDSLAEKIALNVKIPSLDQGHAHIAELIERDFYIQPSDDSYTPLPRNNRKQQEAIDNALKSRFSLIQGPPGTGKTYTGIKLIHLYNKINDIMAKEGNPRKQVLFCGPSNKSVDLVAKWMINRLGKLCPKIVRVYGRSIEAIDYPIPGRTFITKRSTRTLKADDDIRPVALHHLIRQKGNKHAENINEYDRRFKESNYAPQPDVVKKYTHLVREASIEEIRKYDVILCTTAVGSNPKVLEATSVYQVIVDEAGMCPEPQCLVPIIATKAEQIVLIGDHKQLRPIIMCKQAAELGLDVSLFERYALSNSSRNVKFTMLDTQYRMHPQLCYFPSREFYNSRLDTAPSGLWSKGHTIETIWPKDELRMYPHILVHVEGEERVLTVSTEDGNEQSKSNTAEVEYVIKVFRYLIDEGVSYRMINVVSQYNAQCSELRNALDAEGFSNYTVSTVVSSQGGEWDYVIFSTVRSLPDYKIEKNPTLGWCKRNLGFITDKNQINVALTRARKGLIIVGNRNLLQCDVVWKKLVHYYEIHHCIKTTKEFPPPPKTRQQKMNEAKKRTDDRFGDEKFVRGEATSFLGPIDEGWETDRRSNRRNRRLNPQ